MDINMETLEVTLQTTPHWADDPCGGINDSIHRLNSILGLYVSVPRTAMEKQFEIWNMEHNCNQQGSRIDTRNEDI